MQKWPPVNHQISDFGVSIIVTTSTVHALPSSPQNAALCLNHGGARPVRMVFLFALLQAQRRLSSTAI